MNLLPQVYFSPSTLQNNFGVLFKCLKQDLSVCRKAHLANHIKTLTSNYSISLTLTKLPPLMAMHTPGVVQKLFLYDCTNSRLKIITSIPFQSIPFQVLNCVLCLPSVQTVSKCLCLLSFSINQTSLVDC